MASNCVRIGQQNCHMRIVLSALLIWYITCTSRTVTIHHWSLDITNYRYYWKGIQFTTSDTAALTWFKVCLKIVTQKMKNQVFAGILRTRTYQYEVTKFFFSSTKRQIWIRYNFYYWSFTFYIFFFFNCVLLDNKHA